MTKVTQLRQLLRRRSHDGYSVTKISQATQLRSYSSYSVTQVTQVMQLPSLLSYTSQSVTKVIQFVRDLRKLLKLLSYDTYSRSNKIPSHEHYSRKLLNK